MAENIPFQFKYALFTFVFMFYLMCFPLSEKGLYAYGAENLKAEQNHLLLGLCAREGRNRFNLEFGDLSTHFSSYSLNSGLKGFQGFFNFHVAPFLYMKPVFIAARSPKTNHSGDFDKFVLGGRLEAGLLNTRGLMGLNVIGNWDDTGHIRDEASFINGESLINKNLSPKENYVLSVDMKLHDLALWEVKKISVDAEFAQSRFDGTTNDSSEISHDDWALRAGITGALKKLRFNAEYENVQPYFHTSMGSAPVDQELFRFNLNYDVCRWLTLTGNYETNRNNLKKQLENSQISTTPRISAIIMPCRNFSLELLYRYAATRVTDQNLQDFRNTYTAISKYDWKNVYASLSGGYEELKNESDRAIELRANQISLCTGLRSMGIFGLFEFSPALTYSIIYEEYLNSEIKDTFDCFGFNATLNYKSSIDVKAGFLIGNKNQTAALADFPGTGWFLEMKARPENSRIEFDITYEDEAYRSDDTLSEYGGRIAAVNCRFHF